jgi:acyl carrier protein
MSATDNSIILQTIVEELQKVNDENIALTAATDITTDLHVDSLAVMELIFVLEERFDVSIPLNELGDVRTIGQIAQLVESKRMGNVA